MNVSPDIRADGVRRVRSPCAPLTALLPAKMEPHAREYPF